MLRLVHMAARRSMNAQPNTMGDSERQQEPRRERLDVPSSSNLERRLLVGAAAPPPRRRPPSKPAIKSVPPSGLLGRLQSFLPTLEAANADLEQQLASGAQEEVAMERGSDDEREGPYVQLDLACGLFDLKDPSAVAAAEAAMASRGVAVETYGGGSSSSDADSSDDDSDGSSEDEEEGGGARQELGNGAAAAAASQDLAGGSLRGGDAMDEDVPANGSAAADPAAAAVAGRGVEEGCSGAGAAPGRRRNKGGKQQQRHAGIEELS